MILAILMDIIGSLILIALIVIGLLVFISDCIINIYKRKSKKWHNCFECKHYYLSNVASYGDCCWYICKLHNEYEDRSSFNDNCIFRKCKEFEKE